MTISKENITKPAGSAGLVCFVLFNFCFAVGVIFQSYSISSYRTASSNSFTMAEAAYVTSLWTQEIATIGVWIALDLFLGICMLATRITRLHDAYRSSFLAPVNVSTDPADPRAGNHSMAAVDRHDEYLGRAYTVHGDSAVVSRLSGNPFTWRNEREFKIWVDRQQSSAL